MAVGKVVESDLLLDVYWVFSWDIKMADVMVDTKEE